MPVYLSKVSFAKTDITRVRFSEIARRGERDKFKIIEERKLEEFLEYAKSIKYLVNWKDVIKEGEQRQIHFYDNKNSLNIKINWHDKIIQAHSDNSTTEYIH